MLKIIIDSVVYYPQNFQSIFNMKKVMGIICGIIIEPFMLPTIIYYCFTA